MLEGFNPVQKIQRDPGFKDTQENTSEEAGKFSEREKNIQEVFKLNPKLEIAGREKHETEKLYAKYLETIFPESRVKDILWHGTTSDDEFQDFDVEKESSFGFEKHGGVFFTSSIEDAKTRGSGRAENEAKRVLSSLVNIKNPVNTGQKETSVISHDILAEGQDQIDAVLKIEGVLERWKDLGWEYKIEDDKLIVTRPKKKEEAGLFNDNGNLVIDLSHNLNFIGNLSEYQIKPLKSMGYDAVIDNHSEIVKKSGLEGDKKWVIVFDSSQIHILGSDSDIEEFKQFASNQPTHKQ